jgi:hypothetical protein
MLSSCSTFAGTGKRIVTVVPLSSPRLVASIVPPFAPTNALAIQKPRPEPGVVWMCRRPRKNR